MTVVENNENWQQTCNWKSGGLKISVSATKSGQYFYEEISHPEASPPGNTTLIHGLQVLQSGEGRGGGELFDRGLSWRDDKQRQNKTSRRC